MHSFRQDLRFALRGLRKSPGFTAAAVLTLALGIGANTAVFSAVRGVLLEKLPFSRPESLVFLSETFRREGVERRPFSYPDFLDWRARARTLAGIAAWSSETFTLGGSEVERIAGELVTADYLTVLGVRPEIGRGFDAVDDQAGTARPVALVAHDFWRTRYAGDPSLVGRSIDVNGRHLEVVGILPAGFTGLSDQAEIWLPMGLAALLGRGPDLEDRGERWHAAVARQRPGVTIERAQAELGAIASALAATYPDTNADRGALVLPFKAELLGPLQRALLVLLGAVGFVLLLCCANLANLTLLRSGERRREFAVRAALGAGRRRLARQLLVESLVVAGLGALAGVALAFGLVRALTALNPVPLPSFARIGLDGATLAFTALVAAATGVLCGAAPALGAGRADLNEALRQGGRSGAESPGPRRLPGALVVAQVALALVLLTGAGLMLKSLERLRAVDPGFRPQGLLALQLDLPQEAYSEEAARAFASTLAARLGALPSVEAVTISSDTPLDGTSSAGIAAAEIDGEPREFRYYRHRVDSRFFGTLGISLIRGRDLTEADAGDSAPAVIVSEELARRIWPGRDPIGQRLRFGRPGPDAVWVTVVGVAGEVRHRSLRVDQALFPADPDIYMPLARRTPTNLAVVVRAKRDPADLAAAVRREVKALDPAVPVWGVEPVEARVQRALAGSRFMAFLLSGFAAVALALAGIGIFGVLARLVTTRRHEIGVRMALGARAADVQRLVARRGAGLTAAGLLLGTAASLALTRTLTSLLFGVSPTDPPTFAAVGLVLAGAAALASWLPARRATHVDPLTVLRQE
jgi:putative ABC transport system permease protein